MTERRCLKGGANLAAAVLALAAASGCGSMVHIAADREASRDGVPDDGIVVDLHLRVDAIEASITNRSEAPVDVLWDKASIVDTNGATFGVVHNRVGDEWAATDVPGDVSRIRRFGTLETLIVPTRSVIFDRDSGWWLQPLLPVECGPVQCVGYHELVGKTVRLHLVLQSSGAERRFDSTFRITNAVRSSRGTRPSDPTLH